MIGGDEELDRMLSRLKLTAIRDQLDSLLDEAARQQLTLVDTLTLLCKAECARRDERRIQMHRHREVPGRAHAGGFRLRRATGD